MTMVNLNRLKKILHSILKTNCLNSTTDNGVCPFALFNAFHLKSAIHSKNFKNNLKSMQ